MIVAATMEALGASQELAGETVLITAGPTREKIDPVRYLTNRSSGRMGYALAEAALRRGARVLLVSGPTAITPPGGAEVTCSRIRGTDAPGNVEAAARSHHRDQDRRGRGLSSQERRRIRRSNAKAQCPSNSSLPPTFLRKWPATRASQIIVGFAAETENVLENARKKLMTKSLDAIVVNDVSREGVGFDSDRNAVTIITQSEVIEVPETTKWEVAQRVLDQVVRLRKVAQATVATTDRVATAALGRRAERSWQSRARHIVRFRIEHQPPAEIQSESAIRNLQSP